MKNVLIVANSGMSNSGVPNVICQVIESIHSKCNIHLVVFNDDDFYYPFLHKKNVNIIRLNFKIPRSSFKKVSWHFVEYPRTLEREISKIIKDKKIDIVHSFKEEEGWPILKAAKKQGLSLRIAHSSTEFRKRKGFMQQVLAKRNQRKLLKYSSCNIGVCERCCTTLFKKKPSLVLYTTYDEERYNQKVGCKLNEELVLTQVATFSNRKNQLFSINILESLLKLGQQCKLNLVGFPIEESYFEEMKQVISVKELGNYISIIDGKQATLGVYENTSFVLLPSIAEGAPLTIVEAQACGISCFVSDTVTKEINCGGVTFLSLDEGSELWAKVIENKFANNKNKRNVYDMNKFSMKTFSNSIQKIYNL